MNCDVTKKYNREDFQSPPREGAYVSGKTEGRKKGGEGGGVLMAMGKAHIFFFVQACSLRVRAGM